MMSFDTSDGGLPAHRSLTKNAQKWSKKMFDEAYQLVAEGKIDAAIYSIMDKFDTAYSAGLFADAAKALNDVDLSRLDDNTLVTLATVSWWARSKTGCHSSVISKVEKKLLETMSKREVKRCLDGLTK